MKFEKRMKKHIDKTLEENVPNPYPKKPKPSFPHWLKVAVPISSGVLAVCLACAIIVPLAKTNSIAKKTTDSSLDKDGGSSSNGNSSRNDGNSSTTKGNNSSNNGGKSSSRQPLPEYGFDPVVAAPKQLGMTQLDSKIVKRTATKAIANLEYCFAGETGNNMVVSPASFLLAAAGFASVSDGFDLDAFGLVDAQEDVRALLDNWNRYWENQRTGELSCRIDSGVLHQQVGPTYQFDKNKVAEIEDTYVGTAAAPLNGYVPQAEEYFREKVGLTIPVPDLNLTSDGVITYGALSLVDNVVEPFRKAQNNFTLNGNTFSVETALFGSNYPGEGVNTKMYECDTYETFRLGIGSTELLIVLPKEGVSLESISISEAYTNGLSYNAKNKYVYGYLPFFHLQTFNLNVLKGLTDHMSGQEKLYSKIVVDEMKDHVDLALKAIQNSDFCFNEFGVSGQSITAMGGASSVGSSTMPMEFNVDRPFYAISLKDNFPLFVNKVNDPRQQ